MEDKAAAPAVCVTGESFHLRDHLLTPANRLLETSNLKRVDRSLVEAARESPVIDSA